MDAKIIRCDSTLRTRLEIISFFTAGLQGNFNIFFIIAILLVYDIQFIFVACWLGRAYVVIQRCSIAVIITNVFASKCVFVMMIIALSGMMFRMVFFSTRVALVRMIAFLLTLVRVIAFLLTLVRMMVFLLTFVTFVREMMLFRLFVSMLAKILLMLALFRFFVVTQIAFVLVVRMSSKGSLWL